MQTPSQQRRVAVLDATSTMGQHALDVVSKFPDHLSVEVLTSTSDAKLLVEQALKFKPNAVVIGDDALYSEVEEQLWLADIKTYAGAEALLQVVEMETVDFVFNALAGLAGVAPSLAALSAGKPLALAHHETLVVAGHLAAKIAQEKRVPLFPVSGSNASILQGLAGEGHSRIEKIALTTPGGPFVGQSSELVEKALQDVRTGPDPEKVLRKATLTDIAFKAMEARWLFDLQPEQLAILVHPESVIDGMVQFSDGSVKAQAGLPNAQWPVQYALTYPLRTATELPKFDFAARSSLTFEPPDTKTFRNLALAFQALKKGGNMPCIFNAANAVAEKGLLTNQISLLGLSDLIEQCMTTAPFIQQPSHEDGIATDREVRQMAQAMLATTK